jgi:hypothetical protein
MSGKGRERRGATRIKGGKAGELLAGYGRKRRGFASLKRAGKAGNRLPVKGGKGGESTAGKSWKGGGLPCLRPRSGLVRTRRRRGGPGKAEDPVDPTGALAAGQAGASAPPCRTGIRRAQAWRERHGSPASAALRRKPGAARRVHQDGSLGPLAMLRKRPRTPRLP